MYFFGLVQLADILQIDRNFPAFGADGNFGFPDPTAKQFGFIGGEDDPISCTLYLYCTVLFHFTSASDTFSHVHTPHKFQFSTAILNKLYPFLFLSQYSFLLTYSKHTFHQYP